jgi:hypothetical protein
MSSNTKTIPKEFEALLLTVINGEVNSQNSIASYRSGFRLA